MINYEQMAYYYDLLMSDAPYDEWKTFTEKIVSQSGRKVESIIDLGCGTGQITTRLAQAGYQMTGVDYSGDMLSLAQQRAKEAKLPVQFIQQDLRELNGFHNQDVAISYCDVLNYITETDELRTVFKNTAATLKQGGLFIFDIHSLYHVQNHLVNQTFAEVRDDVSYIWFCSEGDEEGEMYHDLTFFAADNDNYSRFDEYHHQQTFTTDVYKRLLLDAGFVIQHIFGDFSISDKQVDSQAERIFIVAVKRSDA